MRRPVAFAAGALVVSAAVLSGCARTAEQALTAPVTVTVVPAEGARPKPVGAGPVTTDGAAPAPSTTVLATLAYTVQVGDTLMGIAEQHATTFEVLMVLNNLKDPGRLGVGQVLLVPEPPPTTAPPATAAPAATGDPAGATNPGGTAVTEGSATTLPAATKEG